MSFVKLEHIKKQKSAKYMQNINIVYTECALKMV